MLWLVFGLLLTLFAYHLKVKRDHFKNTPPGPLANYIPFIGYLPFLDAKNPEQSFTDVGKKYGKIFSLQMGSIFTVVLTDVALIREAFKQDELSGRAPLRVTHGIFFGNGLVCIDGAFWKDQRGLVLKWLRDLGMMKYGAKREVMQNRILSGISFCIDELTTRLTQEINPTHILMNTVGNVVNDFVFGVTYDEDDETWKHLLYLQEEGVKLVGVSAGANFLPILRWALQFYMKLLNHIMLLLYYLPSKPLRFLPGNQKNMDFLLTGIERTHKVYDGIADECERTLDTLEGRDSILRKFLLEKRDREMKNDDLASNCSRKQLNYLLADIFGASLDTTLSTLRWYLLLLAKHQDVQEKVYQEMKLYGLREKFVLEDIEHLPYLKASLNESQRLKTVVPCGIPHGNPNQCTTIGGYNIPQNTMVLPLFYAVHMDEEVWTDPKVFNPDRFIDGEGKFFTPPNFIPFSVGKRMCVGEELAKMFLHLFSANILCNFQIQGGQDFEKLDFSGIRGLTLSPPDHKLIFRKR